MLVVGLDLAGVEGRPTGLCVLDYMKAETSLVYTDEEILKRIKGIRPEIVAIDAPLSLPKERNSKEQRTNFPLKNVTKSSGREE